MSLRSTLDPGTARCPYIALARTEQGFSIDESRYLQLVTAIHVRILLRRVSGCHHLTKIAPPSLSAPPTTRTLLLQLRQVPPGVFTFKRSIN